MFVYKRSGQREEVSYDKVLERIKKLSDNLNVDIYSVSTNVISRICNDIHTYQLDELAAEFCSSKIPEHPDYGKLALRISISNVHKQTSSSFSETTTMLYNSPIKYISDEYYHFVMENKEKINSSIKYARDYELDYFGFKTLERSYLFRVNGVIVERPQHLFMRVALGIHCTRPINSLPLLREPSAYKHIDAATIFDTDKHKHIKSVLETYELMSTKHFIHATPTLFNAGTDTQQLSSCFLMHVGDSIESMYDSVKEFATVSKYAGGMGVSIQDIRGNGSYINGTHGTSNGIVPLMRVFNATARHVDQGGGKRKGSIAVYNEPWHPDIEAFLDLRLPQGEEENRCRDIFTALWMCDVFMERLKYTLATNTADISSIPLDSHVTYWSLFCPHKCPGLSDAYDTAFKTLYLQYEHAGLYVKQVSIIKLWEKILKSQTESGMPYMSYKDSVNVKSNMSNVGTIKNSNLCVSRYTYVLTAEGYIRIDLLCDTNIEVWNGTEFRQVTVRNTGSSKEMLRVHLSNGVYITCTHYHTFLISDQEGISSGECTAEKLTSGIELINYDLPHMHEYKHTMDIFDAYFEGIFYFDNRVSYIYNADTRHSINIPHDKLDGDIYISGITTDRSISSYKVYQLYSNMSIMSKVQFICGILDARAHLIKFPYKNDNDNHSSEFRHIVEIVTTDTGSIAGKKDLRFNEYGMRIANYSGSDYPSVEHAHNNNYMDQLTNMPIYLMLSSMGIKSYIINKNIYVTMQSLNILRDFDGASKSIDNLLINFENEVLTHHADFITCRNERYSTHDISTFYKRIVDAYDSRVKVTHVERVRYSDYTYCFTEPSEHRGIFNGVITKNCNEINIVADDNETAVCNLASIGLPTHVVNNRLDFDKLMDTTRVITRNLNKVININHYVNQKTKRSNIRHRPIGIGVQGLADVFIMLNIPFDSESARTLNRHIFETIYFAAVSESVELAKIYGPYSSFCPDTDIHVPANEAVKSCAPIAEGKLQFDLWWQDKPNAQALYDGLLYKDQYPALRENIKRYGIRNSLLVALMPTASTSQILGFNECFEPFTSNLYKRKTLAGEFIQINNYLVTDLMSYGLWSKELRDEIITNNGSVKGISAIPQYIQDKYKTVWEIKQKVILEMAAERGPFVCQTQSMNIFLENASVLTNVHLYAWKLGLKTGMYYCRTKPAVNALKYSIEHKDKPQDKKPVTTYTCTDEVCTSCSA
jgi:ribonucleoside-diphosphate reductase alpha chain